MISAAKPILPDLLNLRAHAMVPKKERTNPKRRTGSEACSTSSRIPCSVEDNRHLSNRYSHRIPRERLANPTSVTIIGTGRNDLPVVPASGILTTPLQVLTSTIL